MLFFSTRKKKTGFASIIGLGIIAVLAIAVFLIVKFNVMDPVVSLSKNGTQLAKVNTDGIYARPNGANNYSTVYGGTGINTVVDLPTLNARQSEKEKPIPCINDRTLSQTDMDTLRKKYPNIMAILDKPDAGICGAMSAYYSLRDKLGKKVLKGGFFKKDIPLENTDGSINAAAVDKLIVDSGFKFNKDSLGLNGFEIQNIYIKNAVSKDASCEHIFFGKAAGPGNDTPSYLKSSCLEISDLMKKGYDCNLVMNELDKNGDQVNGHVATIDTLKFDKDKGCVASVYNTEIQLPPVPKNLDRINMSFSTGKSNDDQIKVNYPHFPGFNDVYVSCCKI